MIVKKIKNYLILLIIFIAVVFYVAQEERKESYIAFENWEEIICDNFIAYNGEFEQCFQKYLNTFDKNIFWVLIITHSVQVL